MNNSAAVISEKSARRTIRKYIVGGWRVFGILAWIMLLTGIAAGLLGTVFGAKENRSEAVPFDPVSSENEEYVYIDVAGVSDCIYGPSDTGNGGMEATTDHIVKDVNGHFYLVDLNSDTYAGMSEQNKWWNSDFSGNAPEPYRLYGTTVEITERSGQYISERLGLSKDKLHEYIGKYYINEGVYPGYGKNVACNLAAFFSGLFCLLFAAIPSTVNITAHMCIKSLKKRGELIQAARELGAKDRQIIGKNRAVAGDNYIFGRGTGVALRYDDVLWVCPFTIVSDIRQSIFSAKIKIYTLKLRNAVAINLLSDCTHDTLDDIKKLFKEHSPETIYGMSGENRLAYRELRAKRIKDSKQ